jgi:hypothetical protein
VIKAEVSVIFCTAFFMMMMETEMNLVKRVRNKEPSSVSSDSRVMGVKMRRKEGKEKSISK